MSAIQRTDMSMATRVQLEGGAGLNKVAAQVSAGMIEKSGNGFKTGDSFQAAKVEAEAKTVTLSDVSGADKTFVDITVKFTIEQKEMFNGIRNDVKTGNLDGASDKMAALVKDIHANGMPVDVNALVQSVLRESYVDTTEDLKFYADKVSYFNDAKKMTREYTQSLRDFKTGMSKELQSKNFCLSNPPTEDPDLKNFNDAISNYFSEHALPTCVKDDKDLQQMAHDIGLPQAGDPELAKYMTADGIDDLIKNMEEKLSTIGDDAQLANTDLQNVLQKQQQTIQMMSNISKMLSDTALAIIRKIG